MAPFLALEQFRTSKAVAVEHITTKAERHLKSHALNRDATRVTLESVSRQSRGGSTPSYSPLAKGGAAKMDKRRARNLSSSCLRHRQHRKDEKLSLTSNKIVPIGQ